MAIRPNYPAVKFEERDFTLSITPTVSSIGAMVGRFQRGPIGKATLISNKAELIEIFGLPTTALDNLADWYTVKNFLNYTSGILVLRVADSTAMNAGKTFNDGSASAIDAFAQIPDGYDMSGVSDITNSGINIVAKYPGTYGNNISVSLVFEDDLRMGLTDSGSAPEWDGKYYDKRVQFTIDSASGAAVGEYVITEYYNDTTKQKSYTVGLVLAVDEAGSTKTIDIAFNGDDPPTPGSSDTYKLNNGQSWDDSGAVTISNSGSVTVLNFNTIMNYFNEELDTDQYAIVVFEDDKDGNAQFKEKHIVSLTSTDKDFNGRSIYIEDWLEQNSAYISAVYNDDSNTANGSVGTATKLAGGLDGSALTAGDIILAMDPVYRDKQLEFGYLIDGAWAGNVTVMNNIISIVEQRLDNFAILSCGTGVSVSSDADFKSDVQTMRESLSDSSYYHFTGKFKIQFDPYTGKNFNCPISGDIAGIFARTDILGEIWLPPAGYNYGEIQNIVKLPINESKTTQGIFYKKQINLVIQDKKFGGYFLMSQKTGTGRPTAFSDVNIRKLFTYTENNILNFLKTYLWEFNDTITREIISSRINNFLATIQAKEGIVEYSVICDETNNTDDIIASNILIVDILIKPSKAIHNIHIRFTATNKDATALELNA